MRIQRKSTLLPLFVMMAVMLVLAACNRPAAAPPPTRTPLPTFTPTTVDQQPTPDQNAAVQAPAADAQATQQAQQAAQSAQATQQAQAAPPTNTPPPPTNTPPPAADLVANDQINIRQGPGTNYNIIGAANKGERFKITGKNQDGSWWQIDYKGQAGWVFGQLVAPQNTGAVQVAQNIPTPPPAPPPPPPTNTPVPQPAQPAAPPPAAKSNYKFNIVVVNRCERQPAGNWFEGTTYVNGTPQNGYKVVFSYGPDAPPITEPMISGPHPGYPGWKTGYYSHIIHAHNPEAGTWYVWVVDDTGKRISDIGQWTSTGPGEGCNQAVVDFDSR